MTISTSIRAGWKAAFTHTRLVAAVWLWGTALALSAAIPVWRWLGRALDDSPEAQQVLERFSIGFITGLTQYDRFSPLLMVNGEVLALLLLGILSNPIVAAGILEVLVSPDERPLLHRFMRGAGHFYGRFLRLLVVSGVAAAVLLIAVSIPMRPILSALGESSYERAWLAASIARLLLFGAAIGFVMVVTDIARAQIVLAETEVRGMMRAWARAVRFVLRRFFAVLGTYAALAALAAIAFGVYLLIVNAIPTLSWAGIWAVVIVQQAFTVTRAGLRVMRAGAAVELARGGMAILPAPAMADAVVSPAQPLEAAP